MYQYGNGHDPISDFNVSFKIVGRNEYYIRVSAVVVNYKKNYTYLAQ